MRLRVKAKKVLYGSVPGVRGHFPYFDQTVHFPIGSLIFERACAEGIYERDTTNVVVSLVRPGTTYFDVGANIGLLSVPVLSQRPDVNVVSIECSPSTLPWLIKTHSDSRYSRRWTILGTAVGASSGETEFWSGGGAAGAYDGVRNTLRGGDKSSVRVPIKTLDDIWQELGHPAVSVVKMDIEGGECAALQGAHNLISLAHPTFVIEWNADNLRAYNIDPYELLNISSDMQYEVFAFPHLIPVGTEQALRVIMLLTETFLLVPTGHDILRHQLDSTNSRI